MRTPSARWWRGAAWGLGIGAVVWLLSGGRIGLLFLPIFFFVGGRLGDRGESAPRVR